jgi:MoaA/NifB/PqqE/SkfB family radical SAM enzyme
VAAKALSLRLQNLLLARHHFRARSASLLSRPYGLEVDPINNCNLACPGCVHSARSKELHLFDWTSGMLSPERFAAFLDRYGPYALQITLCNYGEPTLNPHTPELIRLAKNYLLLTTLSTNMTSRKFDAEAYAASGLDFMTVSLDGATQPVYERFRKKGDLDLAYANIRNLVEAKRRLGKARPFISWQFLAFEHNAHEIAPALAIAKQLGVDQFRVATPFDVSWDDPEMKPAAVPPVTYDLTPNPERTLAANWNPFGADAAAPAIEREFSRGWVSQLTPEFEAHVPRSEHVCHWLYKNMVMDATGRIIPCCAAPQPKADLVFAQFSGAESEDSFNSEKYRVARLSFADKSAGVEAGVKPHCVDCDWFSDQQAAQIDSAQVRNYLKSAPGALFDEKSLGFLSNW